MMIGRNKMDLVEIKAEEYGLTSDKAKEVELGFSPSIEKLNELKPEYDLLIQKEISVDVCKEAKNLRLRFVKVRTGTEKIHKALKAFYLAGGRFVDAWKNKQMTISEEVEQKLKDIEEYYERIEIKKKEERKVLRLQELEKIEHTGEGLDILEMDDSLWAIVFTGLKKEYLDRKEAELKTEEERIAKEKAEREAQERIRKENDRLKKEAEEKDRKAKEEREAHEKAMAEVRAKAEAEKKKQEETIRKQKEETERKQKEIEAKAKAEQEKLKKEAEEKEETARKDRERLEKQLKNMIECPHCGHKFSLKTNEQEIEEWD